MIKRILLVILMLMPMATQAHRYHFSLVEITKTDVGSLELVHRYSVIDMAKALNDGANLDIDEAALKRYMTERFVIAHPELGIVDLDFIGWEQDSRYLWVYQEYLLDGVSVNELIVQQTALIDIERTQVNTVTTMVGAQAANSYNFDREVTRAVISFEDKQN